MYKISFKNTLVSTTLVNTIPGNQSARRSHATSIARCFAVFIFCFAINSWAASLGVLTLNSGLGQQLDAEIAIYGLTDTESESLVIEFADTEFAKSEGVVLPRNLNEFRLSIADKQDGSRVVKLTSIKPVYEPFLNLILKLGWKNGSYLREFTLLLDPVIDAADRHSPNDGVQSTLIDARDISYAATEAEPDMQQALPIETDYSPDDQYRTIYPGDTLTSLSREIAPDDIALVQVSWALFAKNPHAFKGSADRMLAGEDLALPTFNEMVSFTPAQARQNLGLNQKSEVPAQPSMKTAARAMQDINEQHSATAILPPIDTESSVLIKQKNLNDIGLLISALRETLDSLQTALDRKSGELALLTTRVEQLTRTQASATRNAAVAKQLTQKLVKQKLGTEEKEPVPDTNKDTSKDTIDQLNDQRSEEKFVASSAEIITVPVDPLVPAESVSLDEEVLVEEALITQKENLPESDNLTEKEILVTAESHSHTGTLSYVPQEAKLQQTSDLSDKNSPPEDATRIDQVVQSTSVTNGPVKNGPVNPDQLAWYKDESKYGPFFNRIKTISLGLLAIALLALFFSKSQKSRKSSKLSPGESSHSIALEPSHDQIQKPLIIAEKSDQSPVKNSIDPMQVREKSVTRNRKPDHQPGADEDWFRQQLSADRLEESRLEALIKKEPENQGIKVELLTHYARRKSIGEFATLAREMFRMTEGKNPEWHNVIKMGLSLDSTMQFYGPDSRDQIDFEQDFGIGNTANIASVSAGTTSERSTGTRSEEPNTVSVNLDLFDNTEVIEKQVFSTDFDTTEATDSQSEPLEASIDSEPAPAKITNFDSDELDIRLDLEDLYPHSIDTMPDVDDQESKSRDGEQERDQDNELGDERAFEHEYTNSNDLPADLPAVSVVSDWKKMEIKLDLAILHQKMGNIENARSVLNEILDQGDSLQQSIARALLSKLS